MQLLASRTYEHNDGRKAEILLLKDGFVFHARFTPNWKPNPVSQASANPQALVNVLNFLEMVFIREGFNQTYAIG